RQVVEHMEQCRVPLRAALRLKIAGRGAAGIAGAGASRCPDGDDFYVVAIDVLRIAVEVLRKVQRTNRRRAAIHRRQLDKRQKALETIHLLLLFSRDGEYKR